MKIKIFLILLINFFFGSAFAESKENSIVENDKSSKDYYQNYKSIMFSNDNIKNITDTFPRFYYLLNNKENKNDERLTEVEKIVIENQEVTKKKINLVNLEDTNIYIYLNSIMYIADNAWSIWVNSSKITNSNNGEADIVVSEIRPNYVDLIWSFNLDHWDIVNPKKLIPENMYEIKDNMVNVFLTLSPNQAFVARENKILEGKPIFIRKNKPQEQNTNNKIDDNKNQNTFENLFF